MKSALIEAIFEQDIYESIVREHPNRSNCVHYFNGRLCVHCYALVCVINADELNQGIISGAFCQRQRKREHHLITYYCSFQKRANSEVQSQMTFAFFAAIDYLIAYILA